jgi:hypothetical protein
MVDIMKSGSGLYTLRGFGIKDVEISNIASTIFLS